MPTRTGYVEVDGRYFPLHRKKANDENGGCKCSRHWNECQPDCGRCFPCTECGKVVVLDPGDICGQCYVRGEFGGTHQSKLQRGGRIKGWL